MGEQSSYGVRGTNRAATMLAWLAIGCSGTGRGGGDAGVARAPGPSAPRITALPEVPTPSPRVSVKLLAPGAEPRRPLRYAPKPGATITMRFTSSFDMSMEADGHRMFGQQADSAVTLELHVANVDANGDVHLAFTVRDITEASFVPFTRRPLPAEPAIEGLIVVNDRGIVLRQKIPALEEHPELANTLTVSDFFEALPEESVGIGARWQTRSVELRNGMTIHMIQTHTLVELEGDRGATRFTSTQQAPRQLVATMAPDPLTIFEMISINAKGSGVVQLHLSGAMPAVSRSDFTMDSAMNLRQPELTQAVTMSMKVETRGEAL